MNRFESAKKPVPQINPETGLSSDYGNELLGLYGSLEEFDDTAKFQGWLKKKNEQKGRIAFRYDERFPVDQYANVFTPQNRVSVERLNAIAEEMNSLYASGKLSDEKARELCLEGMRLVLGDDKFGQRFDK